jgi:hypothetical protein
MDLIWTIRNKKKGWIIGGPFTFLLDHSWTIHILAGSFGGPFTFHENVGTFVGGPFNSVRRVRLSRTFQKMKVFDPEKNRLEQKSLKI